MSLVKKLIAGSALILATGCDFGMYGTIFEGKIEGNNIRYQYWQDENRLTIQEPTGCEYEMKSREGQVYNAIKRCGDKAYGLDNAQQFYNQYMTKLKACGK